jgi:Secretion system C-terminal sorting domain
MKNYFIIILALVLLPAFATAQVPAQQPYPPVPPALANIVEAEVFSGPEPGIGNGTALPIPTGTNVTASNVSITIPILPNGVQTLYVRTLDANGKWSITNYKNYFVGGVNYPPVPSAVANIVEAEVFSGTEPGIGNGTPLPIPTGTDVTASNVSVAIPILPNGIQTLYVRTLDVNGKWSITNYKNYFVGGVNYPPVPPAVANIVEAEVFSGTEPGIGNGTALPIPTGTNVTASNVSITIPILPNGVQTLYVRTLDANGKWSITNYKNYFVGGVNYPPVPPAVANIVEAEVFAGPEPGIGNGTPLPIPTGSDVTASNVSVVIPILPNGIQTLYVRSLDANGKWSITNYKNYFVGGVNYPPVPPVVPNIGNLEYYIGTDPGFGNGTPITFAASAEVQLTNIPISISGTLPNGTYVFHIRSKQNPWGLDNAKTFTVGVVVPLTWSYVTAQLQNAQTLVSWATEQEINTNKFEIERSLDGARFNKIGEQLAAGNSTSIKKYDHKDINPGIGFNFYRIKQIDVDGRFTYSTIVKVLNTKNIKEAFIAPNPVIDMVNLVEPEAIFINSIEVYDGRGALVLRKNINSKVQLYSLPVSTLPKGNYVLKVNYEKANKSIGFIK